LNTVIDLIFSPCLYFQSFWYSSYQLFIQGCHRFTVPSRARLHLCTQTSGTHPLWRVGSGELCP